MKIENTKKILNMSGKEPHQQLAKIKKIVNTKSLQIDNVGDKINISICKDLLNDITSFELSNTILSAISPLFLNQESNPIKFNTANTTISNFKHVVFFIEQMPHYTGGRYSIFHQALLLSQFTKVTVISNIHPPFESDFSEDYYNDNFNLIISKDYLSKESINKFDLVIGCPVKGGVYATYYASKFILPLYLILFESPNWVSEFRDGADSQENFWKEYKNCLFKADKIMVPSYESKIHLLTWLKSDGRPLKLTDSDVHVVYPCINQPVADKVKNHRINIKHKNKKFNIVYVSRMTPGKSILPILKKFPKEKYAICLIGKIWTNEKFEIDKLIEKGYEIIYYDKLNDKNKFEIIAEADTLVFPTKFEGFGMPPMEALYMDVPVVSYDLPVLREIYGNNLNYVPVGDVKAFVQTTKQVCEDKSSNDAKKWLIQTKNFQDKEKFYSIQSCANKLIKICGIPTVSVGMIVHNGADYIEYALKSIYQIVNQIIIVDGAVKGYGANVSESTDGTLGKIKMFKEKFDLLNKIEIVESGGKFYENKIAMQNIIAKKVTGKYYVKIDADEIWKKETLLDAINFMEHNKDVDLLRMPFYHFWLSFENIAKDKNGKWSTKHPRIWRWKKGYKHIKSFNFFNDKDGKKVGAPFVKEKEYNGDKIYHFGYARSLNIMEQKLEYYKTRGIEKVAINTMAKWKTLNDPTQPTQVVDSWAEKFDGSLPTVLDNHPYKNVEDIRKL